MDRTDAANQGFNLLSDSLGVIYDDAGNVRFQYRRKVDDGTELLSTGQAHFYGADNKLRVSQKYHYTEADEEQRGSWEEYWYDALGRRVLVRTRTDDNDLCTADECDPGVERIVWDGDRVLMEFRADATTGQYTTGSAYYGRITYTNVIGGAVDRPLDVMKDTTMLAPYLDWRGQFAGGTDSGGTDCNPPSKATGARTCSSRAIPGACT